VLCPRAPVGVNAANVLGHLHHHVKLERPHELGMVMSDMAFSRLEEIQSSVARELRPALAKGHLTVLLHNGVPHTTATFADVMRPAEGVGLRDSGLHVGHNC
jgi:hypothetical protein